MQQGAYIMTAGMAGMMAAGKRRSMLSDCPRLSAFMEETHLKIRETAKQGYNSVFVTAPYILFMDDGKLTAFLEHLRHNGFTCNTHWEPTKDHMAFEVEW